MSTASTPAAARIHPSAIIEAAVEIGPGTAVWDHVHIRGPACIGHDCIVGEKTYIAYGVHIANYVKINAQVYICSGVTIEDHVMVSAGVIFTNDRYPRAFAAEMDGLADSRPTADTLNTTVQMGATIGAGALIRGGIVIGAFAMVGMGAVVVNDVPPHALVFGNPARQHGHVCVCGTPVRNLDERNTGNGSSSCNRCGRAFSIRRGNGHLQLVFPGGTR